MVIVVEPPWPKTHTAKYLGQHVVCLFPEKINFHPAMSVPNELNHLLVNLLIQFASGHGPAERQHICYYNRMWPLDIFGLHP